MSYPGGYPHQGPQPGQWPGQPTHGQPVPPAQPHGAPYGQSGPHQQAPQTYGQPAQFGGPQGQFGQQQLAPQGPPGITVDASYEWFGFLLGLLTKPKISINGQPVPNTRWGENHIPVGPGNYHVWVATPWLFDMGAAQLPVQIAPGQGIRVYYKPPAVVFVNGAIGLTPQKTPGMVFVWLPIALVGVLVLLILVLTLAVSL
ncbi:hypothetical protein [Nocardia arizonensis]|uniref:hypothetical protein n=1 Tax=Nocardia arizonensis TaxID=1141647 RepID=UPI0006D009C2|nr:hypothetical protein [Nocardia arizonensis]